ncbi:MAG: GntR family transcriptional regulator [Betaproteobacteria bacterium]|nr:GntR family transcriptional regulator [Betaproteobacteria bacterium]
MYARMVESLQEQLTASSISLIIKTSGYDLQKEYDQVTLLIEHGVDCVIVVGEAQRTSTLQLLAEHGVPIVLTYASSPDSAVPSVGFVNSDAAASVAQHLYALGHRRHAMISGVSRHNDRVRDRITGFVSGLGALGVPLRDIQVVEVEYLIAAGYDAMRDLLRNGRTFTAVFCGSDVLAVGALKACIDAGLQCPRDISIVGFDNLEIGEYVEPALTTVEVSGSEMGVKAAEIIVSILGKSERPQNVRLDAPLIVRRSTGKAPD